MTAVYGQQGSIIYESQTITQKKGEPLNKALTRAGLTDYQIQLISTSAIQAKALSDRSFRFLYEIKGKDKLLREVLVTRGNSQANFLVRGDTGKHRLISGKTQINPSQIGKKIRLISHSQIPQVTAKTSAPAIRLASVKAVPLYAISFVQQRGQALEKAWQIANLNAYQQKILKEGDYIKQARSDRHFTLYFDSKNPQTRKLLGLIVVRGKNRAEYVVKRAAGGHTLKNLKTVDKNQRIETINQFAKAEHTYLQPKSQSSVKPARPSKTKKPTASPAPKTAKTVKQTPRKTAKKTKQKTQEKSQKKTTATKGKYRVVRLRQNKGQPISRVLKKQPLSNIQKELIAQIPVTQTAKSTRYFNLLFEHSGKNKYLKAARVTRAGKSADFVLVKYQGKWTWANSRGQITLPGQFKRYPLNYRRISSHFNLRRRHPITRRIRPHKGTDFAAPHGTPVYAPYQGVVRFAGRQRGYGIILELDHQNGYRTKYAHLSRISRGLKPGTRVRKGQLIARVGNTGISTGAHLHYEVLVNGKARNPLTVKLPGGSGRKTLNEAKKLADRYLPILRKLSK